MAMRIPLTIVSVWPLADPVRGRLETTTIVFGSRLLHPEQPTEKGTASAPMRRT